jgi:hypothetical protein
VLYVHKQAPAKIRYVEIVDLLGVVSIQVNRIIRELAVTG